MLPLQLDGNIPVQDLIDDLSNDLKKQPNQFEQKDK